MRATLARRAASCPTAVRLRLDRRPSGRCSAASRPPASPTSAAAPRLSPWSPGTCSTRRPGAGSRHAERVADRPCTTSTGTGTAASSGSRDFSGLPGGCTGNAIATTADRPRPARPVGGASGRPPGRRRTGRRRRSSSPASALRRPSAAITAAQAWSRMAAAGGAFLPGHPVGLGHPGHADTGGQAGVADGQQVRCLDRAAGAVPDHQQPPGAGAPGPARPAAGPTGVWMSAWHRRPPVLPAARLSSTILPHRAAGRPRPACGTIEACAVATSTRPRRPTWSRSSTSSGWSASSRGRPGTSRRPTRCGPCWSGRPRRTRDGPAASRPTSRCASCARCAGAWCRAGPRTARAAPG